MGTSRGQNPSLPRADGALAREQRWLEGVGRGTASERGQGSSRLPGLGLTRFHHALTLLAPRSHLREELLWQE